MWGKIGQMFYPRLLVELSVAGSVSDQYSDTLYRKLRHTQNSLPDANLLLPLQ